MWKWMRLWIFFSKFGTATWLNWILLQIEEYKTGSLFEYEQFYVSYNSTYLNIRDSKRWETTCSKFSRDAASTSNQASLDFHGWLLKIDSRVFSRSVAFRSFVLLWSGAGQVNVCFMTKHWPSVTSRKVWHTACVWRSWVTKINPKW